LLSFPSSIYSLSLHDALPICHEDIGSDQIEGLPRGPQTEADTLLLRLGGEERVEDLRHVLRLDANAGVAHAGDDAVVLKSGDHQDRKSTRLNSSHGSISYAVF